MHGTIVIESGGVDCAQEAVGATNSTFEQRGNVCCSQLVLRKLQPCRLFIAIFFLLILVGLRYGSTTICVTTVT